MKNRLLILSLALLLAALASSAAAQDYYTLPEIREQAANGWHETYTDKYGRTRQVDVDIDVFGEDAAPVIKACWGSKYFCFDGPAGEPLAANQAARKNGNGKGIYLYENIPFMKVNLDEAYGKGYGSDLTLREAYDFCERVLQGQGMSFYQDYMWEQPCNFSIPYSADKDTGELLVPAHYSLRFCQEEFGLPILTDVASSFKELQVPFTSPIFFFEMRDQEAYSFFGHDLDVAEVLAEDIPLC